MQLEAATLEEAALCISSCGLTLHRAFHNSHVHPCMHSSPPIFICNAFVLCRSTRASSRWRSVEPVLSCSSSSSDTSFSTCSSDCLAVTQTRRTQQNQPNRCPSLRRKLLLRRGKRHHADGSDGPLTQVLANLQRCGFSPRRGQQLDQNKATFRAAAGAQYLKEASL